MLQLACVLVTYRYRRWVAGTNVLKRAHNYPGLTGFDGGSDRQNATLSAINVVWSTIYTPKVPALANNTN